MNEKSLLENKTLLVTGGTGSFGKRFIERVLKEYNPRSIRILSRDEFKQSEMMKLSQFQDDRLRFLIGDIRDKDRLYRAFEGVDIVIHAAAQKQVPASEFNPFEAIKTNILGSQNVIDAALDTGVEKVVALSTDKAVSPVNLYGATKLCEEKIVIQANSYAGSKKTRFACTRYGNVVGSRGSVVPLFLEQRKKGVLTVTDKGMTRFWITLDQSVDLVIHALTHMRGGEIFIPKVPSTKVTDLARVIAPTAKVKVTGIRPGEKLHEDLMSAAESAHAEDFGDFYVIQPEFVFWKEITKEESRKQLPVNFCYNSGTNDWWLTDEEISQLIDQFESNRLAV